MATGTAATSARQYHTQQVHYLRKSIAYTDDGTEVTVGWIPSGAMILAPASGVQVSTAFNAGTSNVLDIGGDTGNDDPDDYATDLALGAAGFVALDEAATGVFVATADTKVTCTVALTGTAASAGAAEVVICYIPDNDG
jgi:hypothetical protein